MVLAPECAAAATWTATVAAADTSPLNASVTVAVLPPVVMPVTLLMDKPVIASVATEKWEAAAPDAQVLGEVAPVRSASSSPRVTVKVAVFRLVSESDAGVDDNVVAV